LALRSRDAALIGSRWSAAKAGTVTRASLAATADGMSWTRAKAADFSEKLHQAQATASPWVTAAADTAGARLGAVSATARQVTERQMEQAAFLVMRLRAQAKGEIDALRRAAHEGKFALPRWNQVSAIGFTRKGEADGGEARDAGGKSSSRNALIPVEPWRCRLPAVRSDRLGDQFLMGAISRAPTEASRSS
jgi:hypothetical protein